MKKSALLIIFLVVFIDLVGFGIVIPILPYYAKEYGASAFQLGWLMAIYSVMQFLVAPLWGKISDQFGRRPVLLVSILGTAFSMMLLGLAGNLKWLFIARFLAGTCGANISTAYAYIADVTPEDQRARGMGLIGAGFGLGFIFGPAIGGVLSRWGFSFPMYAGALLALCNFFFALVKLEEPKLSIKEREANRSKRFSLEAIGTAMADRRTRFATLIFFLSTLAIAQMETTFAIFMAHRFGYDAQPAGFVLALMGIIMATIQGGLIGKLAKRFGEYNLIVMGALLCAVGLGLFPVLPTAFFVILSLCIMSVGNGILNPSLSSLASLGASPRQKGLVMGVYQSASSLARVLGPLVAGWLYDRISIRAPFFAAAILFVLAFTVAAVFRKLTGPRRPAVEPVKSTNAGLEPASKY
ncbi:MAG: MFS transporter [Bdellovibrionota bacterium]